MFFEDKTKLGSQTRKIVKTIGGYEMGNKPFSQLGYSQGDINKPAIKGPSNSPDQYKE